MDDYENITTVTQPRNLKVTLFKHQLASIYKMEKLERERVIECNNRIIETNIGIIADPPGYGKTITIIGLIARDKMEWDLDLPFVFETIISEAGGRIKIREIKRFTKLPTTLILVSQSIICQWEEELKKTSLKISKIITRYDIDNIDPEEYDVILVVPSLYNKLITAHSRYAWKRFIFDEPGHIRVPSMKEIQSGFIWFVTATPSVMIEQHKMCKTSFMNDIIGNNNWIDFETNFSGMILKNDMDFIKKSFKMPPITYFRHECFQPVFNVINGFVKPSIITMIEAGNIEGALSSLGGCKTSNLIELVQQKKKEELHTTLVNIDFFTLKNDEIKVNELIIKKTNIITQINELENRFQNMLKSSCGICLENISSPVLETNCQNLFCGKCLLTWLRNRNSCPLCRHVINISELIYMEDENIVDTKTSNSREMTKIEKVIDIIKNIDNGKILIFSAYDNTFKPICTALTENDVTFVQIKGTVKMRQKNILSFKRGNTSVIFLNSTTNSAGINLQESTDIILYHEMDSTTHNQIIGRANRIGRILPLKVHYLQIKN